MAHNLWQVFALADLDEAVAAYRELRRRGDDVSEAVACVAEAAGCCERKPGHP